MNSSFYIMLRIYILTVALFFLWMYINKQHYYENRYVFHSLTVFLPILLFSIGILYLPSE